MIRIAISRLKASLSEYLHAVRAGEEIIITDRGRPVAKIVPIKRGAEGENERIASLVKSGVLRPGGKRLTGEFWEMPRPADPRGRALKALIEERGEGR